MGKVPSWILGIVAVFFIESSMISLILTKKRYKFLSLISLSKSILILLLLAEILINSSPSTKAEQAMLLVILNTLVGVVFFTGILGYHFYLRGYSRHFGMLVKGVIILLPSSIIFLYDINLFRWFDRNDLCHLILGIGITWFYLGVIFIHKQKPCIVQNYWQIENFKISLRY